MVKIFVYQILFGGFENEKKKGKKNFDLPMLFEEFIDTILTNCVNLMLYFWLINNRMNHSDNEQPVLESPNFPQS